MDFDGNGEISDDEIIDLDENVIRKNPKIHFNHFFIKKYFDILKSKSSLLLITLVNFKK